jgi:multisubunit Na+/H+ antiporter MnhE subunit
MGNGADSTGESYCVVGSPYVYARKSMSTAQFLIAFIVAGAAGTLVFFHAERNQIRHPSRWASFVFLFLIIGLPAYAIHVRRVRRRR